MSSSASEPPPKRHRICVLGASLDVGNRGVVALGVSLAFLFNRVAPGSEIVFHYGNLTGGVRHLAADDTPLTIRVFNCRMSPKSALREHVLVILVCALLHRLGIHSPAMRNPWLRSLLDADVIGDIRGGDSFSDIYGFRRFVLGSLPLLSVALLGRAYVMLPQTYGPFKGWASRRLARWFLRRAQTILTRDSNCVAAVQELCGRTPQVCPDVAFTMRPMQPAAVPLAPSHLELDGTQTIVGINVSGLLYMGGYTRRNMFGLKGEYQQLVDDLIARVLNETEATVLLIPHVFGSEQEEEACAAILRTASARHPGRVLTVSKPLSERELKWIVGRTNFFVGSRMHACIAAISQGVPAVGLAYSDKFLGVFDSAGVGDAVIDLRSSEPGEVIARTLHALSRADTLRGQLASRVPQIQAKVVETFRGLLPPPPPRGTSGSLAVLSKG